jgi:hypothetical protein
MCAHWAEGRGERGGKKKRVWRRGRLLLKRRQARQGEVGVPGAVPRGGANGAERGGAGSRPAGDNMSCGAMADKARPRRVRAVRRGHAMRPTEQGWGKGWLTGGPWPQCRTTALADRRARAAQCRAAQIQTGFKTKIFQTDSKFSKLGLIQKVSSLALKIRNKIGMERS